MSESTEQDDKHSGSGSELSGLVSRLRSYLDLYHPHIKIDDLEISDSKGYWRVKGGCKGGINCTHAFRRALGPCEGKTDLTISFSEHGKRDENGRWINPYRVWEAWRELYG